MRTQADMLMRLAQLDAVDRRWVVRNLPGDARARLLQIAQPPQTAIDAPERAGNNETPTPSGASDSYIDAIARASAASIADALRSEPLWIAAVVLKAGPWAWQSAATSALGERFMNELGRAPYGADFTSALTESVLRHLAARIESGAATSEPVSRFETLLAKLSAARAKRRLALRI
jgi:hypothetical protein